jgi:amino acid adenylation domain-containing protein
VWATDLVLTFAELDTRAARMGWALRARGIGPGDRVGVCLPRGAEQLVTLLAIWRVGAAYVPLDPGYPAGRLAFMAADAGVAALVGGRTRPTWAAGIELLPPDPGAGPVGPVEPAGTDGTAGALVDPAYVMYTSGSTGRPKGVEVTHGCLASLIGAYERAGVFAPEARAVALNASISFDASVHWVRVCRGDTIVVLDERHRRDADTLRALLEEQLVTDLDVTPTHWEMLRAELLPPFPDGRSLRLFIGGEAMPRRMWREIADADGVEGFNLYGPTECTVDVTAAWIDGTTPHLGRPLPDSAVYLLDDQLRPVPDGAVGELFVGGPRLATGYVSRPGLTAARFLPDPFGAPGTRMYRTGDRAHRSADGTLAFAGRVDRQVKLRGCRIELGEVEHHLAGHPDVARAVVVLRGERLVAYVVPIAGRSPPGPAQLASHLAARVPAFMVPATFIPLDRLPTTGSDKVDLDALPAPAEGLRLRRLAGGTRCT